MKMCYFWIVNQVDMKLFYVKWHLGAENLANFTPRQTLGDITQNVQCHPQQQPDTHIPAASITAFGLARVC